MGNFSSPPRVAGLKMVPHLIPSSEFVSMTTSYGPLPEAFLPVSSDSVQVPLNPPPLPLVVVAAPVVAEPVVAAPVVLELVVPESVVLAPPTPLVGPGPPVAALCVASPPVPLPDVLTPPVPDPVMPPVVVDAPLVGDVLGPELVPLVEA